MCTAHIHWDPEFSDVKLIQTMMLMKELKTILEDNCKLQFRPGLFCSHDSTVGAICYVKTGRVLKECVPLKNLDFISFAFLANVIYENQN